MAAAPGGEDQGEWWKVKDNIRAIKDYALQQGLLFKATSDPADDRYINYSVTITPSKFPTELFQLAYAAQSDINALVDAVSEDQQFLENALERVIKTDHFTGKLFQLYKETLKDKKQTCVLALLRSDYMVDYDPPSTPPLRLRQIEINTISAAYFPLTENHVSAVQKYVHTRYCNSQEPLNLPENNCLNHMVDGMACAWKQYGNNSCYILFVVQSSERNLHDQRPLEFDLWTRYGIRCMRKTLTQLTEEAILGQDGELIVSGHEVAVVYYRAGYTPKDYPSEKEWAVREVMDRSRATNCPSVAYQLVGTKKVQQVLAAPGVLERFLSDPAAVERVRSTFAGQYSLDLGEEGDRVVDMALREPEKFVMKPQREGGGNNVYGKDVGTLLQKIGHSPEREAYILMDMVHPVTQDGFTLNPHFRDQINYIPIVSELGVLGVYVRKGTEVLMNTANGYICRDKPAGEREGGVSIMVASLGSPNLVPSSDFIKSVCKKI